MDIKYKIFVLNRLYGLIEGTANSLKYMLLRDFQDRYGFLPELLTVLSTDKFIIEEYNKGCWIGTMTVRLIIEGEEYVITRDWGDEYKHDFSHPDYRHDDYFYDGHECYSYKKYNEILESLVNERFN